MRFPSGAAKILNGKLGCSQQECLPEWNKYKYSSSCVVVAILVQRTTTICGKKMVRKNKNVNIPSPDDTPAAARYSCVQNFQLWRLLNEYKKNTAECGFSALCSQPAMPDITMHIHIIDYNNYINTHISGINSTKWGRL